MKKINKDILDLSQKVLTKILKKGDKIKSLAIVNGMDIISDFVNHGGRGLAFEHLEYIIAETNLELDSDESNKVNFIAKKLGLNEN